LSRWLSRHPGAEARTAARSRRSPCRWRST
jgi:hypothetical protein